MCFGTPLRGFTLVGHSVKLNSQKNRWRESFKARTMPRHCFEATLSQEEEYLFCSKIGDLLFMYGRSYRISPLLMNSIFCILLVPVSLHAATYTVKSGGGGNYTTIQACATAMAAGDTCQVFAGSYAENVSVSAGTVGNYKTLTVNTGDTVNVLSFTISSHVKIKGFHIQNPSSPTNAPCVTVSAGGATDYYITNNTMYACGTYMIKEDAGSNTTHGYIQGNTLSYSCSTSSAPNTCTAMQINGDYHLIENNDISHVSDGFYVFGKHNILRKNTFHDVSEVDCGSNSGNCHVDFMQADANVVGGAQPAQYLLIENNTVENLLGSNMHAVGLFQAGACKGQCFNAIVRFHTAAHVGGGGILDDDTGWINVKSYNNTWADVGNQITSVGNAINAFTSGSTGGSDINDIFYFPFTLAGFNPYFTDSTTATTFTAGNNLGFCSGSPCTIFPHTYGAGSWTSDTGNIQTDPLFANYAANDLNLLPGSPALGTGTYLTTVSSGDSGSGMSLVVNDAGYFQDGSGLVNGDCIAVTTTLNHVCITAVNYLTKTLTLSSSISRSAGDHVWLYSDSAGRQVLRGSGPNMGAAVLTPAPPTNLSVIVQ